MKRLRPDPSPSDRASTSRSGASRRSTPAPVPAAIAGAKVFRAATLRDALAQVRRDLGGGAVILGTREVRTRGFLGLGRRERIEVVASRAVLVSGEEPKTDAPPAASPELQEQFGSQLGQLHAMVEALSRHGRIDHLLPEVPGELVPAYAQLVEAEVPEALARRLVRSLDERLEPRELTQPIRIREALVEAVGSCLAIAPPIAAAPGARRVVALVGPTGVGKTTTVAKLAAEFKLGRGLRPGLLTVDTYRIAAVEQLRTYAEILGLSLEVVNEPDQVPAALERLAGSEVILIDTAGRSPRDEVKIRELGAFLERARPDETHLVLSAGATERSLRMALERFAPVGADRLILTKLDEAETLGNLFGVLGRTDRPVSYLTTGQAVPDDIEPADRTRLARLILRHEAVA